MARIPRNAQTSPYYHILVEGSAYRDIFEDPTDKDKYLEILSRILSENKVVLYAYCVMNNHAHLVLREGQGDLSRFMKRLNGAYALYFNRKYTERGQVFYDRYKSENIQDMDQLLGAIRFVHNNPVNSGSAQRPCDYLWSSYRHYVRPTKGTCFLTREHIWFWFGEDRKEAVRRFVWYMMEKNMDRYLELEESLERKVRRMIDAYLSKNHIELRDLGYKENTLHRDTLIFMVRTAGGFSIRKIGELLDQNRGTVYNVLSKQSVGQEER